MDAVALAIRMRTSAVQVPSLDRDAPRYLKLLTCSSVSSIHCDACSDVFHAVDHDLRLFGTYFHTKCTSAFDLLVRSCSSPLLPPIRSMSSANRKLQIGLPPMEIVGTWS